VTIQVVPLAGDLAMLLTAAVVLALLVAVAVQLVLRRPRPATRLGAVLAGVVGLYGAVLVGAALAGAPRQLRPGDAKCFDDWCAAMVAARPDVPAGRLLVDVRLENRGRGRAMRADLARAYLEVPGRGAVAPEDGRGLQAFLRPGQQVDVELAFDPPGATSAAARFVVVEGADTLGPGTFTIGGEGSPLHARAGWPMALPAP
jgi:hypothetical protein